MERLGFGYEDLQQDNPGADLLLAVRLRPHRALQGSPRLRSGRAGDERHHELHRRGAGRPAGEMRRRRCPTSPPASSPPWAFSPPTRTASRPARASGSRPRCSRRRWCRPTGSRRSRSRPASRPRAMGSAHPLNAPYQAFEAADGWIVVGGANQKQLAHDRSTRSARPSSRATRASRTTPDRMANLKELEAELEQALSHQSPPRTGWRCWTSGRALRSGQRHAAGACRPADHRARDGGRGRALDARAGEDDRLAGQVLARRPARCARARRSSASTRREILAEYGFSADEIAALEKEGAVVAHRPEIDRQKVA